MLTLPDRKTNAKAPGPDPTKEIGAADFNALRDYFDYAERTGLNRTKLPRRLFSKLYGNAKALRDGTDAKTQIRVMGFGDSQSRMKPPRVTRAINEALGCAASPVGHLAWLDDYDDLYNPTVNPSIIAGTFAADPADGFTYWPMSPLPQLVSGSRVRWLRGNDNPIFTKLDIYYVKTPGAGSFQVLVDDVAVATLDANSTTALGKYTLTQAVGTMTGNPPGSQKVELLGVSGIVRIVGVWSVDAGVTRVEQWNAGVGGISLISSFASATARQMFAGWLADANPDLFIMELSDDIGWETGLNQVADILDASVPTSDKVFVANAPGASSEYRDNREVTERVAYERGYIFFDGNTPLGSHAEMVALGWEGDGIHPDAAAQEFLTNLLLGQLGLSSLTTRASVRPTLYTKSASRLGSGTTIEGDAGVSGVLSVGSLAPSLGMTRAQLYALGSASLRDGQVVMVLDGGAPLDGNAYASRCLAYSYDGWWRRMDGEIIWPTGEARGVVYGGAAPTTGAWAAGSRVFNAAPAVGQPKGWICTVTGTPGTWVSEGNL